MFFPFLPVKPVGQLFESVPSNFLHLFVAVHAHDSDGLCGSNAVPAAGANQLSGAALLRRLRSLSAWVSRLAPAVAWWRPDAAAPVDLYLVPALLDDIFDSLFRGLRDRPAVFLVVLDAQAPPLRFLLKLSVVVASAPAAILYPVGQIVEMYHLMQHGGHDFFNGPVQCLRSQV